ncbi:hypothetical protein V8E53_004374 [Lactarius tabidus]
MVHPGTPELNNVEQDVEISFNYPGSDVVLRSCDSRDFPLPKLYILICSPILGNLIGSVSTTWNISDGEAGEGPESLPVVKLPENGATLYNLLTFIFPVDPILPSTTEKIMELLAVARKYQMMSVLNHIRGIISQKDPPFVRPETAHDIYFLAQRHQLRPEAVQAARVTLRLPMTIQDLGDKLEFPGLTGAYLHELWKYHQRVRSDLKSGVFEFRSSGLPDDVKRLRCLVPDQAPPQWLDKYIESIVDAPHLFDPVAFENDWACHILTGTTFSYKTCSCVLLSGELRRAFWEALTTFVLTIIEKADSTLALVKEEPTSDSETSGPPSAPLCLDVPDANVIIRSSDRVNFRVHKSLLSMSSPFFKDLFSLPQPPLDELVDGLPVVQVPENADILNSLVSFLYPISPVIPRSYKIVFALLAACQKYDMVLMQPYIREEVKRGSFPRPDGAESFGAYAIASTMGLDPEMEDAACRTLGLPMTFESLGEDLRSFKGRALRDLILYRAANDHKEQDKECRRTRLKSKRRLKSLM